MSIFFEKSCKLDKMNIFRRFWILLMSSRELPESPVIAKPELPPMVRVWVIEDHDVVRESIVRILSQSEGIECTGDFTCCEDALERLKKVSHELPHVVLIDLELPGMTGMEGIRAIVEAEPEVVCSVLSVLEDSQSILEAICAGATGYLLKATGLDQIPTAVKSLAAGGAPINSHIAKRVIKMFQEFAPQKVDHNLSKREEEVLKMMVNGHIKKKIAEDLSISHHTVNFHIRAIYRKLQVNTRSDAVAKALRGGFFKS